MEFNLVNIAITVQTDNALGFQQCLPNLFREFSSVFKGIACRCPARVCDQCSGKENCAWFIVFGQKLSVDPDALKRHQKPPLPFVFSLPVLPETVENDIMLECGLVVIGRAIQYLEVFLEAFAGLLASDFCPVSAKVIQAGSRDFQGDVLPIANSYGIMRPEDLIVLSAEGLLESRTWSCSEFGIRFLSPVRLIENGRPLVRFDFNRFIRSLMRRVSALAYYYCEFEFDCDYKELSRQAETIVCTEDHFCQAIGNNSKTNGITGYGTFCGDVFGLMPFLILGTYLHTGKAASFGMGQYELLFHNAVNGS